MTSIFRPFVTPLDVGRFSPTSSEKLYNYAWSASLYHLLTKTVAGLGIGIGVSVLFFKKRTWPIAFTTGIGLGMAYSEATHIFWSVEQKLLNHITMNTNANVKSH
jgi:inner membrane organizing system protein 1